MTWLKQALTQVGSDETRAASYQNPFMIYENAIYQYGAEQ